MTSQKDIAKKQAEIVGQLQQFPIGRTNSGGRAGGTVEVVITNPLPGQPRVVQAKCANDCPPGDVQIIKADDGSYVALSPNAARSTGEKSAREVSKKNPTIPQKDGEFWPVTSCFLYSRIKATEEDLTDNLATDLTSYDGSYSFSTQNPLYDSTKTVNWNNTNAPPITNSVFVQRADTLGDYETALDAFNNSLKADRTFQSPGGGGDGGDADDRAWGEGSQNAVTAWFYIGDMTEWSAVDRNIFYASGNGYGNWTGPDYASEAIQGPASPCMTMYGVGAGAIEALYASLPFGSEPLSKYLKQSSFQGMGGKIGYWGSVHQWHGMQDLARAGTMYDRTRSIYDDGREPTSQPPNYPSITYPAPPAHPWGFDGIDWYSFGWPRYTATGGYGLDLNCSSKPGNIRVYNYGTDPFSSAAGFQCGGNISGDNWSGYRLGSHSTPWMQYGEGDSLKNGMFVCWQGDLANLGMARAFCSALQDYWSIGGGSGVTLLGSCNPYGCKGAPGSGGNGYPVAPLAPRIIAKQYGHKAEIWLKVCEKEKAPIELKLPFEFAAVITKFVAQNGILRNGQTTSLHLITSGSYSGDDITNASECPHATMSVDKDFVYIDILYGGEREWAVPQTRPVPTKVSQGGSGTVKTDADPNRVRRVLGMREPRSRMLIVGEYNPSGKESYARYKADYFAYCQSFKIALPKSPNKDLTIIASQRYRRGQTIQITEQSPDNEFNNKFLICDFRTDMREQETIPSSPLWSAIVAGVSGIYSTSSVPNPDYASFGGLPALLQARKSISFDTNTAHSENPNETLAFFDAVPKFYKPQLDWTDMDKIHFQLQESPRMFWPGNTILPFGEFVDIINLYKGDTILFDNNGKFGKHGRASTITSATMLGSSKTRAPDYGNRQTQSFLLYTSFKEQLIGNGLKNDAGLVVKWNRACTSSFPVFGQLPRRDFGV